MDIAAFMDNKLTHEIHTSERKSFRACRRRWDWTTRQKIYPRVTAPALEMGVAIHAAMEHYYQPDTWHDKETARDVALVVFRRSCEAQLKKYKELNGEPTKEIVDEYRARIELGLGMLRYYFWEVAPSYDKDFTPIAVEIAFHVPIVHPDTKLQIWCKCEECVARWNTYWRKQGETNSITTGGQLIDSGDWVETNSWQGLPVTYGGRIDMLARDKHDRIWIVDWKTTSRILDADAEASFLQLDDQITSYCWALWMLGYQVAGFVYVEIKKAFPQPPEMLTRLYKGRKFSTSKQFLTTPKLVLNTIMTDDSDAWQMGLYDDYLRWLETDGPKFTQRHQVHRNENELRNAGAYIGWEALDITGDPHIYPQPGRFSCTTCLFRQPCLGMNMGEDYQFMLDNMYEHRTTHYWETSVPTTE